MIRRAAAVLAAVLLAAGCGSEPPPPEVTFAAGSATAVARPTQYCDLSFKECRNDDTAPVTLAVPVGTPLKVTVPDGIATTPWQVAFVYRDAAGQQVNARSTVFAPNQRRDYSLELPAATDRLLTAQVQQFGPPPQANTQTGVLDFPIRASWVLTATGA